VLLRGGEPEWTFVDRVLAVASVLAEDLRCPGCGQPKHESWNPDSEGYYETHEATCQGCLELHRANEGEKEYRPERKIWVSDTRPRDQPLRPWDPLALPVGQVDQDQADEDHPERQHDRGSEAQPP
jgi:hypothetical protein